MSGYFVLLNVRHKVILTFTYVFLQFRDDVLPSEGGLDLSTRFVHRMVDFAIVTVCETRNTGEPGEIISEIVNVRH